MRQRLAKKLVDLSGREHSTAAKALALVFGAFAFGVVIPWVLLWAGTYLTSGLGIRWPGAVELAVGVFGVAAGLFFLLWAVWAQVTIGLGTPSPLAPTRKLIVKGPYRLCRNPIQLGATLYYLGLGALLADLSVGLFAALAALAVGGPYHRFVEEEELRARFGAEYEEYRKRTPFLWPRFGSSRKD